MKHSEILPTGNFLRFTKRSGSVIVLFVSCSLLAQKSVTHQQLLWYGYYNTLKINKNWNVLSEVQERQFYNPTAQHQLVFRSNIQRKLIDNWNASAGMTLFLQSPQDPEAESSLIVPELRPDIGFDNKQKFSFMTISHRYKAEARFFHDTENNELSGGYRFSNFRFRYQLGFDIPVIRKKHTREEMITVKVKDEVMFNAGSTIVKNVFDQNRIYAAVNYRLNPAFAVEVGYMNWYQQRTSGTEYYDRDILRISLFHTISLKNK
ncbi:MULTISPECIES: DUF2490 domain-containing protein [unclassified Flavobacterium]|uniref:DUF2490 domain-containing protein n=1 Tax=unclassified Flavobacterium TaxID=196869 RepID=UPI0009624D93|nr:MULTISPECIES: DUF2490 domain-containing protein [unclassified Flavobacterium]MBN9283824.1 DUF2490 domain-containing protein [Flavobacterium sp.]OJV68672.1 MAG: hypothetical protein BGO42_02245 [Flavobacterium sp. 40-81]